MADIKRAQFFTKHKLVEGDLNQEQAYHVRMRRHHNASLHSWGVVSGLAVTRTADMVVRIDPGTAVDATGREIVLEDARAHELSHGNNLDVFLTIAYAEEPSDPVTHDDVSDFIRVTERPLVVDSRTVPPTDGSVILLARIRLNASGVIDSGSNGINPSVRTLASAHIVAGAIDTAHLADNSITPTQLAHAAKPLALQASNAVTVTLDDAQRRVTIGESHSERTDNPHAVTAAQVDTQGGQNRIVAQINAGLGVIAQARIEPAPADMAVGSVTFSSVAAGAQVLSEEIDPGLGAGPLCIQLALDDFPSANLSRPGDTDYGRLIRYSANLNPTTGRFKVAVFRVSGAAGPVKMRWFAFKAQPGPNSSVAVGVTVVPTAATLVTQPQGVEATVTNASNTGVTWSAPDGGTLSNVTNTSVTYTPNEFSGARSVIATSVTDPSRSATTNITVNAPIFVTLSKTTASVFDGRQVSITADVFNTTSDSNVSWSIVQGAGGGSLSASTTASGSPVTYTAPFAAGTFTVRARSAQDPAKFRDCQVTVTKIQVSISPESPGLPGGGEFDVFSTVSGLPVGLDNRVHWTVVSGGGFFRNSPSTTGRFQSAVFTEVVKVRGTSVVDGTKFGEANINVVAPPPPPQDEN